MEKLVHLFFFYFPYSNTWHTFLLHEESSEDKNSSSKNIYKNFIQSVTKHVTRQFFIYLFLNFIAC